MSEIMEDIAYLSQEIGPRPAGTEEEQQAAIYVSDVMKKRTGFETVIEDFSCNTKPELVKVVLSAIVIIFSLAAMVKNIVVIPAILVSLICAVFYVLEVTGRPLLSKALRRGVSQNVVSKYQPVTGSSRHARKIVFVASYDSAKVSTELASVGQLGVMNVANLAAMVGIPLIWIARAAFGMQAEGAAFAAWTVVTVVALLLAALPVLRYILHNAAQYNEAANCNAASVAAMMEVARRIANTPEISSDNIPAARIHGEEAAREEGLVPDGAEIEYSVDTTETATPALQGASVLAAPGADATQAEGSFVYLDDQLGWPGEYSCDPVPEASQPAEPEQVEEVDPSVPEWYARAQKRAKKSPSPATSSTSARRSSFAIALDHAVELSHQRAQAAAAAEEAARLAAAAATVETARAAARVATPVVDPDRIELPATEARAQDDYEGLRDGEPLEAPVDNVIAPHADSSDASIPSSRFRGESPLDMAAQLAFEAALEAGEDPYAFLEEEAQEPVSQDAEDFLSIEATQAEDGTPAPDSEGSAEEDGAGSSPSTGTVAIPRIDVTELRREMAQSVSVSDPSSEEPEPSESESFGDDAACEAVSLEDLVPSITAPQPANPLADLPQIDSGYQQRAPLAGDPINPSARIPRVNLDAFGISTAGNAEPLDNKRAALRSMIPSLSGSISYEQEEAEPERGAVSTTGSFAPVSMSGSMPPVGDELIEGVDPADIYVDDADDSDYETSMTESGAYAGPGYVEMPESRAFRLFGKFRRRKQEVSTHEWLDVDSDYSAREVGAQRGGWESFAEENRSKFTGRRKADEASPDWDEEWNGGAFSKVRAAAGKLTKRGTETLDDDVAQSALPFDETLIDAGLDEAEPTFEAVESARADVDGIASSPAGHSLNPLDSLIAEFDIDDDEAEAVQEIEQIEDFHQRSVDVEVWFVALGAECAGNGGSAAFFEEHADELRGASIVNIEGLGAGAFCQVSSEGTFGAKIPSPRLKRLVRNAQKATGVTFGDVAIHWKDSIASLALKRGFHAITLAGIEKGKPAYMGQGDDVIENVDEEILHRRIEFLEAIVRNA